MKRTLLPCLVSLLATGASAHRLDEYLQATRVSVASNRIDLSIDLTPGVAVADQVLAAIDEDRDGQISKDERAAYAHSVLKDIRVNFDDTVLVVGLTDTSFPALQEFRSGTGIIRIKASASVRQPTPGPHSLSLTNAHLPAISVYLVNALVPKDDAIEITKQTRDNRQTGYRLEFAVRPRQR